MDATVPAALGDSQRAVLELLKRHGTATVDLLEAHLDLARETVRDHLKSLAAQGLVERSGVRRSGPGRPRVVYRLTARTEELFPQREGPLLAELVEFLRSRGEEGLLADFFSARLARKRERLLPRLSGLDGRERLAAVAGALTEDGFLAEAAEGEGGPRLRLCHCPLRRLVAVSHLPCRAEMALVAEALGEDLRREAFMPDGDLSCTYVLRALRPDEPARETDTR